MRLRFGGVPDRRAILGAFPALAVSHHAWAAAPDLAAIERASGGKLGVYVIDTGSGQTLGWRADQRFPFCSSCKLVAAGCVLAKVDRGELRLDQPVAYGRAELLSYAPITRQHADAGVMPLGELCAAAIAYSDNTAANLLFKVIGGPQALTAWARGIGDAAFDLSDNEPGLNRSRFGDARDTTTPRAMAETTRRLVAGGVLSPASRLRLTGWLVANTTGGKRIRAGLPRGWRVGDKTGTWDGGWFSTIDVAVAWPPGRRPLVVSGFVTDQASTQAGEAALAEVARLVSRWAFAHG